MITLSRLGTIQLGALEIYIFDPAHDETPFPGMLTGSTLTVTDVDAACALLTDAANSADLDDDAQMRDALTGLCHRTRLGRLAKPRP